MMWKVEKSLDKRMRTILARQYSIQIPQYKLIHFPSFPNLQMLCIFYIWSKSHLVIRILGMFVHVTNTDPRHIGVYFLQIALSTGGIPQRFTSDYGYETVDMATWQISIQKNAFHPQHNCSIIGKILTQIENGIYDPDDTLHKLLFNPACKFGLISKIIIKSRETTPSQPQLLSLHTLHTVLQNILAPPINCVTIQTLKQC
ncbi:hypothetical protein VP01_2818g3 [Puccinia sorghi]|uniref:Uncharacterized protein n=1 Tax=Puccinia sorghi TaxID=27349 RepID=A0A0L6V339_9BASI|nr:hypothetical protein VP01_2818g3 [Puccinia sorghi]